MHHSTLNKKENTVILSEFSEFVAPAFGRNNQFRSESKDLRLTFCSHHHGPHHKNKSVILSEASETLRRLFGATNNSDASRRTCIWLFARLSLAARSQHPR
jgi:hypothetical protein